MLLVSHGVFFHLTCIHQQNNWTTRFNEKCCYWNIVNFLVYVCFFFFFSFLFASRRRWNRETTTLTHCYLFSVVLFCPCWPLFLSLVSTSAASCSSFFLSLLFTPTGTVFAVVCTTILLNLMCMLTHTGTLSSWYMGHIFLAISQRCLSFVTVNNLLKHKLYFVSLSLSLSCVWRYFSSFIFIRIFLCLCYFFLLLLHLPFTWRRIIDLLLLERFTDWPGVSKKTKRIKWSRRESNFHLFPSDSTIYFSSTQSTG